MFENKTLIDQFFLDSEVSENLTMLNSSSHNQTIKQLTVIDPFYLHVYDLVRHAATLYVFVSFLLGIPGNILVILVQYRVKPKTITDWLIIYIAVCDIMSLLNVPLFCLQFQNIWSLFVPDFFCKYHYFNMNSVSMASYMFCACTAIERFYKVVHSKEIFSMTQVKLMWIPIFIISFGIGSIVIFAVHNNLNNNCMYNMTTRLIATIEYAFLLFVAFGSSIVMTVCYLRTGMYLRIKMKEMSRSNKSFDKSSKHMIQTTKMLAVVTAVFLFSANVPYVSGMIISIHKPTKDPFMSIALLLGLTFFFNNFFNPFLYMAMSASFRQRSKELFISCCRCWLSKYETKEEITESSKDTPGKDKQNVNEK